MTRSVWKGPFVDGYLLKKADAVPQLRPQGRDQDLVAPLDDHAPVRGPDLRGPQRPEARPVLVSEDMVGHEAGRVRAHPLLPRSRGRQEGQEEVEMSKQAKARRAPRTAEAVAKVRTIRISPRKLNLVAQSHPRPESAARPERAGVQLAEADRPRRAQGARTRRSPTPRTTTTSTSTELVVAEAYVGKNLVMKRFHARARGRASRVEKPFSEITIVVREVGEAACLGHMGQRSIRSASPRHQPHLGQPLVRRRPRVRATAARRHQGPSRS